MIASKIDPNDTDSPISAAVVERVESGLRSPARGTPAIEIAQLAFCYNDHPVLKGLNLKVASRAVTAIIGPSGCGKSTLLRCLNRMNDTVDGARITGGSITLFGRDIHEPGTDVFALRRLVGMVFERSNPFPKSIFENVAYGLRVQGERDPDRVDASVQRALENVGLWAEVKDRLDRSALELSGGQQQRLCIARAIAVEPEVILMDEPCSALDPGAAARIEELIFEFKRRYTVVLVTHNLQQAGRASDFTAMMHEGRILECARTDRFFTNPSEKITEDFITGRMAI
jgi:phosphate transport system ATP-binding protein